MSVLVTLDTTKQTRESKDLEPATIPIWVVGFYHVTAFVSLISLLYVVVSVTAVSVWAPQLALRGSSPRAAASTCRSTGTSPAASSSCTTTRARRRAT